MAKFKLLNGTFSDKKTGKTIQAGGYVECDKDLVSIFPNKFKLVGEVESVGAQGQAPSVAPKPVVAKPVEKPIEEPAPIPTPLKKTTELGTEVTDRFPTATKSNLRVFRKNNQYNVTDAEEIGEVLNDQPLNKLSLVEFLTSFAGK